MMMQYLLLVLSLYGGCPSGGGAGMKNGIAPKTLKEIFWEISTEQFFQEFIIITRIPRIRASPRHGGQGGCYRIVSY
jgi:hypothetical protein